jgi:hypothetical protein
VANSDPSQGLFKPGDYIKSANDPRWGFILKPSSEHGRWFVQYSGGGTGIVGEKNLQSYTPTAEQRASMERQFAWLKPGWPEQYQV